MCFLPGIIHSLVNISIKLIFTSGMFLYIHNETMNNLYFCVIEAHCSYLICGLGFSGGSVGRCPGEGHGNHYCILAWRLLWTEDPGGLQSTGSRVRHH